MKPLVVIPARGGSKGILDKNIKNLNGKNLIYYTIDLARKIFDDSSIIVSTDSKEIISVVEERGLKVPFIRPANLATDFASMQDVLIHSLDFFEAKNGYKPESIILLQPTSPFRKSDHVLESIKLFNTNLDMVVSVKKTASNPYYVLFEENDNGFLEKSKASSFTRRQDCPDVWEFNGAIYIINTKSLLTKKMHDFKRIIKYEMDDISSLDIDNHFDWMMAEMILKNNCFSEK